MNGANQYLKNEVQTASPEKLLIMLYDGAIRFCNNALIAHGDGNQNLRREMVSKVLAITTELSNNVDHDNGGDVAVELDALYGFIINDLPKINIDDNVRHIEAAYKIFKDLREAYSEILLNSENKK